MAAADPRAGWLRLLLVLLLLGLVGLAIWAPELSSGGAGAAPALPGPARAMGAEDPATAGEQDGAPPELQGQRQLAKAGTEDGRIQLRIRIVDGTSGLPVPGAEVRFGKPMGSSVMERRRLALYRRVWGDSEAIHKDFGELVHSDAEGYAVVPQPGFQGTVTARAGGRMGQRQFNMFDPEPVGGHVIRIWPDRCLRVQVVDAQGAPVTGATVRFSRGWSEQAGMRFAPFQAFATDKEGMVQLPHAQACFDAEPGPWCLRAQVDFLGQEEDPHHLWTAGEVQASSGDVVRLQLPPCGKLVVKLRYADGRPIRSRAHCILSYHRRGDPAGVRESQHISLQWGESAVMFLPLGLVLDARATVAGVEVQARAKGPEHDGQEVELRLVVELDRMAFGGRLLDERGAVIEGRDMHLRLRLGEERKFLAFRTDAEGRFRILGPEAWRERATELHIVSQPPRASTVPAREVRVPAEPARRGELGELRMQPVPLLLGGRVTVDGIGTRPGGNLLFEREVGEEWQRFYPVQVRWLEDGGFAIHGGVGPGRLRLRAESNTYLPIEPIAFEAGARDVLVELQTGAALRARLRLPELPEALRRARGLLQLRLAAAEAPVPELRVHRADPHFAMPWGAGEAMEMQWLGIRPGTYTLQVFLTGFARPIHEVMDLRVLPGPNHLPRLQPLDLSRLLAVCAVRVRDAKGGELLSPAVALIRDPQGRRAPEGRRCAGGQTAFLYPVSRGGMDLEVHAEGYHVWQGKAVKGLVEVQLQRRPKLLQRCLIEPRLPQLPEGWQARLRCVRPPRRGGEPETPRYVDYGLSGMRRPVPGSGPAEPHFGEIQDRERVDILLPWRGSWFFSLELRKAGKVRHLNLSARPRPAAEGGPGYRLSWDAGAMRELLDGLR